MHYPLLSLLSAARCTSSGDKKKWTIRVESSLPTLVRVIQAKDLFLAFLWIDFQFRENHHAEPLVPHSPKPAQHSHVRLELSNEKTRGRC